MTILRISTVKLRKRALYWLKSIPSNIFISVYWRDISKLQHLLRLSRYPFCLLAETAKDFSKLFLKKRLATVLMVFNLCYLDGSINLLYSFRFEMSLKHFFPTLLNKSPRRMSKRSSSLENVMGKLTRKGKFESNNKC